MLVKTDTDAKKQNRRNAREYVNGTFTNDRANIGKPFLITLHNWCPK